MAAIVLVTLAFCFCLRQYKVLMKVAALALGMVAVVGMVNPGALNESATSLHDAVLYKGHKEEGVLGSRRSPWEETVSNIKEHPWLGTGYGTSLSGEDTVVGFRATASTADTSREHGSSYMTIVEWVGLLGVAGIHRDRFCPPEADEDNGDRADNVQMGHRIQREAALQLCGRVPQAVGHPSMSEFVNCQRQEKNRNANRQVLDRRGEIEHTLPSSAQR